MKKAKIYKIGGIAIKTIIIILAFAFIVRSLFFKENVEANYLFFSELHLGLFHYSLLALCVCLMFVNWGLEIHKWRYLLKGVENVSFWNAFTGVFTGITVSTFTPNRTGEYAGRVFVLKPENRWQGVILTVVGSISQLVSTTTIGFVSFIFFLPHYSGWTYAYWPVYLLCALAVAVVLLFYFKISLIYFLLEKIKIFRKTLKYAAVLKTLKWQTLSKVLLMSVARHIVFSSQFFLLLLIFGLSISFFESLMLSSVVFLFITIIPTIALTEMGIRGAVSIFIFAAFFNACQTNIELIVLSASFFLWIINLVIPALTGVFLVTRLKFFK